MDAERDEPDLPTKPILAHLQMARLAAAAEADATLRQGKGSYADAERWRAVARAVDAAMQAAVEALTVEPIDELRPAAPFGGRTG